MIRKAYGGAKPAMGIDKDLGVDLVYAWPIAESAVMGAKGTVKVLFGKEMKEAKDPEDFLRRKVEEFRRSATAYPMAHSTFIDDIIEPAETRHLLIRSLEGDPERARKDRARNARQYSSVSMKPLKNPRDLRAGTARILFHTA